MLFKKWREELAAERALYKAGLSFTCECCELSPRKGDSLTWSDRWESKQSSGLCRTCCWKMREERERRIGFMRSCVSGIQNKGDSPYRNSLPNPAVSWSSAKDLANSDPHRNKRFDKFIKI